MAKLRASYVFTNYSPDRADDAVPVTYRGTINVPIGVTQAEIDGLVANAGATLVKWNGLDIAGTPAAPPCPEANNFYPRKLVFLNADGDSMSIPVGSNDPGILIQVAQDGITVMQGADGSRATVLCVKLVGERWRNIMGQLGQANKTPVAGVDPRGETFSGRFSYTSDAGPATLNKSFKMDSDIAGASPTYLGFAPLIPAAAPDYCPGRDGRKTRRYIVSGLVTRDGQERVIKTEVPVATAARDANRTIGTTLAAAPAVACIGYEGESYNRFHLILPTAP